MPFSHDRLQQKDDLPPNVLIVSACVTQEQLSFVTIVRSWFIAADKLEPGHTSRARESSYVVLDARWTASHRSSNFKIKLPLIGLLAS